MSETSQASPALPDTHYHAVRFYENENSLAQIVAQFLGDGLAANNPAIVVATPTQRGAVVRELVTKGFDIVKLQRNRDLVLLDAEDTLASFMMEGSPDADKFKKAMREVIEAVTGTRGKCTLRIYGQMVDVLWQNGNSEAAIRLEMLWNQLAAVQHFSLLCGYAMGSFYKDANIDAVSSQHTHVLAADGSTPVA
jgi:hypothetical protein